MGNLRYMPLAQNIKALHFNVLTLCTHVSLTVDVKLVNWNFMDFKIRIRTTTPLFFLHKKLKERHGRMNDLKLYKRTVNEDNLMVDEFKTFEDYGVPGGPKNSAPVVRILS